MDHCEKGKCKCACGMWIFVPEFKVSVYNGVDVSTKAPGFFSVGSRIYFTKQRLGLIH